MKAFTRFVEYLFHVALTCFFWGFVLALVAIGTRANAHPGHGNAAPIHSHAAPSVQQVQAQCSNGFVPGTVKCTAPDGTTYICERSPWTGAFSCRRI